MTAGRGAGVVVRVEGRPPTPNSRRHWRSVAKDSAEWKTRAWAEATLTRAGDWEPIAACTMHVEFVVPDRRRRDLDNLIASTKPLTDGIVLSGLLVDDSTEVIREVSYSVRYEKGVDATVYTITPVAA